MKVGPGEWSYPALECATPSAPFPAPHPISILGATTNSATIAWPECHPPYDTLEFEVQLRILSDGFSESGQDLPNGFSEPGWRTVWVGTSNTVRITHLESGCAYAARVRTNCDQGYGDWSCGYKVCFWLRVLSLANPLRTDVTSGSALCRTDLLN